MASAKINKLIEQDNQFLFQNYGNRLPVAFSHGRGDSLYDIDGKEYIDFFSGIAVSNLGHGHKGLTRAIQNQAEKLLHTSNWYLNPQQIEAARLLSQAAFPGKSLFVNSGTEANEAALKLARRWGLAQSSRKTEIISFTGSFHGRTFGAMTATAQEKIHGGFGPLPAGFTYLPFNDLKKFRKHLGNGKKTAAVILEPVQGEGGINLVTEEFIQGVAGLCRDNNILLILDEVQTGIGRTGRPFAFQHFNVEPDIITLAKGLGGGLPVGALHAHEKLVPHLPAGSHGTTFGGNHLVMAAATVVLKEIIKPSFMKKINQSGDYISQRLHQMEKDYAVIREVRGLGLHLGIQLDMPCMDLVTKGLKKGLVINCTAGSTLRIMPPLNISMSSIKKGMKIFEELIREENNNL